MRKTAGYTLLDHKRNEAITKEFNVQPITDYTQQHRQKWLQNIHRMGSSRMPRQILLYMPRGTRSVPPLICSKICQKTPQEMEGDSTRSITGKDDDDKKYRSTVTLSNIT